MSFNKTFNSAYVTLNENHYKQQNLHYFKSQNSYFEFLYLLIIIILIYFLNRPSSE